MNDPILICDAMTTGGYCHPPEIADLSEAGVMQEAVIRELEARGWRRAGGKIGLGAFAAMAANGLDEPLSGILFAHMHLQSGAALPTALQPRVEAAICFRIGRDLPDPGMDEATAIAAIDAILPALEIVDSRYQRLGRHDSASVGGKHLGGVVRDRGGNRRAAARSAGRLHDGDAGQRRARGQRRGPGQLWRADRLAALAGAQDGGAGLAAAGGRSRDERRLRADAAAGARR